MDVIDAGRKGGTTTLQKYGREYFKNLRKKSSGRTKKTKGEAILPIDKPL